MLEKPLKFSHKLISQYVVPGDIVIDATVGNGQDTVKLASLVGPTGKVFGYDLQDQALEETRKKLMLSGLLDQVTLFHKGHENIQDLGEHSNQITATIFNLGYLPKGDKSIVTQPETTLSALESALELTRRGGIVLIMVYHGHDGGPRERDAVLDYVENLKQEDYSVLQYQFINQKNNPPFLLAIEKR